MSMFKTWDGRDVDLDDDKTFSHFSAMGHNDYVLGRGWDREEVVKFITVELMKFMEAIQLDSDFEIDIRKCSVEVQVSLMKFKLLISQKLN